MCESNSHYIMAFLNSLHEYDLLYEVKEHKQKEIDKLQAKLDIAVEALKEIRTGYWVQNIHYGATWWSEKQVDEALKKIEAQDD